MYSAECGKIIIPLGDANDRSLAKVRAVLIMDYPHRRLIFDN